MVPRPGFLGVYEPVVLLSPMEGSLAGLGQVVENMFRQLDMNVELVTLSERQVLFCSCEGLR